MLLFGIDKNRALQAAERLQAKLRERGDAANEDKLSLLKSVLQSPLFSQILSLQSSVQQLKDQVGHHLSRQASWHVLDLGKGLCFPKADFCMC
jgi:hypothetical protein